MQITIQSSSITFSSSSLLKKLWRQGKLPTVKYGFYGDRLTQENLSQEHLRPKSQGGKTEQRNLVLDRKSVV